MRTTNVFLALALLAATVAPAAAGTVRLPATGETVSQQAGDDGDLKAGIAWPSPRFAGNPDRSVTDRLTGLIWPSDADTPAPAACGGPGVDRSWQGALDYVACLNTNAYLGRTGWRLPNALELASLVNAGEADSGAWLGQPEQGFAAVNPGFYWSSTSDAGGAAASAWSLRISDGAMLSDDKTALLPALPVWGGQQDEPLPAWPANIRKTGQTTGQGAGDDGSLGYGVAWPAPRFAASADGRTITDLLTRLTWAREAGTTAAGACGGGVKSWQGALDHVACLNANAWLGRSDWRLPNRSELASLIDYSRTAPALPPGHPFSGAQPDFYWTSTSNAAAPGFAWLVSLADGALFDGDKNATLYVWPVSGPATEPAEAGAVRLPETGQTAVSAAGDDGALQIGVTPPVPRFTANPDQTMTDQLTGLVWTADADSPAPAACGGPGVDRSWQGALDLIACLNANAWLGHSDWRLPNINELAGLADAGAADSTAALAGAGFGGVGNEYWSATTESAFPSFAWALDARSGEIFSSAKGDLLALLRVWPVRGGGTEVQRTGQTLCHDSAGTATACAGTDQDGDTRAGVSWSTPRFTQNADLTVTDRLTRLVWPRDLSAPAAAGCAGGAKSWQGALDYVACLNGNAWLGHGDWRLPNRNELRSLTDYGASAPALPAGHPFAGGGDFYWSSTISAPDPGTAWVVNLSGGEMFDTPKDNLALPLPVRGGEAIAVTPLFADFGAPPAGAPVEMTLSVANSGIAPLRIDSVVMVDDGSGRFAITENGCAGVIAPGANCAVTVSFDPATEGFRSGGLTIASSDPVAPIVTVPLSGAVPDLAPPAVTISSPAPGATNIESPLLLFAAGDGHPIVTLDGAAVGKPSGTRLPPMTEGEHTVRVESTDLSGNSSAAEVILTFVRPNGKLTDNGVGAPTVVDALHALRIAVGALPQPADITRLTGDVAPLVNGKPVPDGKIGLGDAVVILRRAVGEIVF